MQKPQPPTPQQKPSRSLFSRYGGRMTTEQIRQLMNRQTMHSWQREYINRVVERYHSPVSPHITEDEFKRALQEMVQNTRDPVDPKKIEEIKRFFGL